MSTTTIDIEELRAAEREALQRVRDAETSLRRCEKHNQKTERLLEEWKRRTQYDREPRWADDLRSDGLLPNGKRPDIACGSPVPAERITELEQSLAEAREAHQRAVDELERAVGGHQPEKPSTSNYVATKAKRIGGIDYSVGDPVAVDDLSVDKLAILIEGRYIAKRGGA